jgi:hypothetical protein
MKAMQKLVEQINSSFAETQVHIEKEEEKAEKEDASSNFRQ